MQTTGHPFDQIGDCLSFPIRAVGVALEAVVRTFSTQWAASVMANLVPLLRQGLP
jgi:hypothetical protein